METLRQMTKLEKSISDFVMDNINKSLLVEPDNLAMAMVEIIDSKHGKVCNITMLFKDSFKPTDSDILRLINKSNKKELNTIFSGFFDTISFQSQSTIQNYIDYYQPFNKLKNTDNIF